LSSFRFLVSVCLFCSSVFVSVSFLSSLPLSLAAFPSASLFLASSAALCFSLLFPGVRDDHKERSPKKNDLVLPPYVLFPPPLGGVSTLHHVGRPPSPRPFFEVFFSRFFPPEFPPEFLLLTLSAAPPVSPV